MSAADKLYNELHQKWEETKKEGMSEQAYIELLRAASPLVKNQKVKKKKTLIRCFDALWTVVLVVCTVVLFVYYWESYTGSISKLLHGHIYSVTRISRLAFIGIHPYLLTFGLDLTQPCLVGNPLANNTMQCPCIKYQLPIELNPATNDIPSIAFANNGLFYIVRNFIPITENYGRDTLMKYVHQYGHAPSVCLEYSENDDGPNNIDDIVSEEKWKHLMSSSTESWGFMW